MDTKKTLSNRPRKVSELKNIGTLIAKRLNEIGVDTEDDLRRMGAVEAHRRIKNNYPDKTLSVCYYLYSFEAALRDIHWDDLSNKEKEELKNKATENKAVVATANAMPHLEVL